LLIGRTVFAKLKKRRSVGRRRRSKGGCEKYQCKDAKRVVVVDSKVHEAIFTSGFINVNESALLGVRSLSYRVIVSDGAFRICK
jgi:hypothetical protein